MNVRIHNEITSMLPTFKVGVITYHDIVVSQSPQMIRGRLQFFQESIQIDLETKAFSDFPGIKEWRGVFKTFSIDPSKYRPSQESLYRRIRKEKLPAINSAADINNFFSLQYEVPIGIYDLDCLKGEIVVALGKENDHYYALNNREVKMERKLLTKDDEGAFGSPIVDSQRTLITERTKNALQIVYLRPSMDESEAAEMLKAMANMFTQVNGGTAEYTIST
jgi:DNA/RNA-binding domain of Phe-tRNA-synthetase-like protein